jgi:shikimate dehydrogenase
MLNHQFNTSLEQLKTVVSSGKQVYGIFGSPIAHSFSPLMHNEAFKYRNINAVYLPFLVVESELKTALKTVVEGGISGLNITLPLKQVVIPLLDSITPDAKKIGAVNTIVVSNNTLKGYNTDLRGFLAPLRNYIKAMQFENAVVFGSGGAAHTVLYALLKNCKLSSVTLITIEKAQGSRLLNEAESWKKYDTILQMASFDDIKDSAEILWNSRLVINCTPLGMSGYNEDFPERFFRFLRPGQIVYDLIYTPLKTKLLYEGEKRGAIPISGLDMLIEQGAASFKLWTQQTMPIKAIKTLLLCQEKMLK